MLKKASEFSASLLFLLLFLLYIINKEVVNPDGHTYYSGSIQPPRENEKNMESIEIRVNSLNSCNSKILEK